MVLMNGHVNKPVPELDQVAPDLPPALGHILMRCLAKDPNQRPATPEQLVEEIQAAGATLPIRLPDLAARAGITADNQPSTIPTMVSPPARASESSGPSEDMTMFPSLDAPPIDGAPPVDGAPLGESPAAATPSTKDMDQTVDAHMASSQTGSQAPASTIATVAGPDRPIPEPAKRGIPIALILVLLVAGAAIGAWLALAQSEPDPAHPVADHDVHADPQDSKPEPNVAAEDQSQLAGQPEQKPESEQKPEQSLSQNRKPEPELPPPVPVPDSDSRTQQEHAESTDSDQPTPDQQPDSAEKTPVAPPDPRVIADPAAPS